jgi:flavin-dependent dehydrogenase
MTAASRFDVLIAGAGPAGMATALHLLHDRPDLGGRIVAIEKGRHPRFKPCAGGLIPKTRAALDQLGIALDPPGIEVHRGVSRCIGRTVDLGQSDEPLCTVVRRDEFDARLALTARSRGLILLEETHLRDVQEGEAGVRVVTDRGSFEAGLLVGADGSGSRVRASVFGRTKANIGRAVMLEVPVDSTAVEFAERLYRFDFDCIADGVQGYSWSFPCVIDGQPHLNLGIYDQRWPVSDRHSTSILLAELRRAFPEARIAGRDGEPLFLAYPIRWFHPNDRYASARVLLAGDAAGVDPLMGEGISYAFEHGRLAATAIAGFLTGDQGALADYDRTGLDHAAPASSAGSTISPATAAAATTQALARWTPASLEPIRPRKFRFVVVTAFSPGASTPPLPPK